MKSSQQSRSFLQALLQKPPSLPFEPALLPMLFTATKEDSMSSTSDLAALIDHSQNLATRVLSVANSASYGLEFKVSTLQRAISILGIREIRLLAVMVGMAYLIKNTKLPDSFNVTALWKHQLNVAVVAKVLAAELGGASGVCGPSAREEDRLSAIPDEAYVAGLLHDIGKVFFAASRPDLWEEVEIKRKESSLPYFEVENAYWGMDHALIGVAVLHHWKLPLLLTEPINWHHAPELSPTYKMEARLLAAANQIAHNGLDAKEGLLCGEAISLLPQGVDAVALGSALARSLVKDGTEVFEALVK